MIKKTISILLLVCVVSGCAANKNEIRASGTIEADEFEGVSQISGIVTEFKKNEGDFAEKDDTIVVIDNADAVNTVNQAVSNLRIAEAKRDEMLAGTRPEQIKEAEAGVLFATAQLNELMSGARPEQIKAAEAAEEQAKANLDNIRSGSRTQQIEQAEYDVSQAETALAGAREKYEHLLEIFTNVSLLYNRGAASKSDYDKALLESDMAETAFRAAEDTLGKAESQLDLVKSGATKEAIAAAQAQYDQAAANTALLKNGASESELEAARANVDRANAALLYLQNGRSQYEIEQVNAGVEYAEAALETAKNQLQKYEIKAPISGIILYKNIETGEVLSPGVSAFTVQAKSDYWIKVYLPQKHNGKAAIGQKVKILASNLPDEEISGTITWISPKAEFTPKNIETTEAKQENTVFAVKIIIDDHLDSLYPGMNATVILEG